MPDDVAGATVPESMPIIDISALRGGTDEDLTKLAHELRAACETWGFAYFVNHGVPQADIDATLAKAEEFFDSPTERKESVRRPDAYQDLRGWIAPGREQVHQQVKKLWPKEQWQKWGKMGEENWEAFCAWPADVAASRGKPNLWPSEDDVPGFREPYMRVMEALRDLGGSLLTLMERSIEGAPPGWLSSKHTQRNAMMRINKYRGGPKELYESKDKGWFAPHTDFGSCTLVISQQPGLEVARPVRTVSSDEDSEVTFVPVEALPGSIIFNIGNHLERLTNDMFKSSVHRVAPPPAKGDVIPGRTSIICFTRTDDDATLEPMPGTWSTDRPKKYEPMTVQEYSAWRLKATGGKLKDD